MVDEIYYALQLGIYIVLMPISWLSLTGLQLDKLFKKNHVAQIQMFYILATLAITKIAGDFIITFIELFRNILL